MSHYYCLLANGLEARGERVSSTSWRPHENLEQLIVLVPAHPGQGFMQTLPGGLYATPLTYILQRESLGGVNQDRTIKPITDEAAMNQSTVSMTVTNLWQVMNSKHVNINTYSP